MQSTIRSLSRGAFAALLTVLFLVAPGLQAQQTGTVTGRVTQAQTGQPIPSVQVYVSGLDLGVLTQQNGRFLLQNVPSGTHTLNAERIGYRSGTQEITVSAGETVVANFTLSEEALQLDEVIVTGTPGGTQRRALGNSVGAVSASEVTQRQAITSVEDLLSARSPGVNFQNNQGNIGAGSPIQIRGVSSLALGAQPLIYVDGVRIDNSATLGPDGGLSTGRASSINDFNPEDIESIEIIKGPAAATLYGTEASAGVIQIITKQGQSGAPEFNFRVRQGFNYMASPGDVLGPKYRCASPTWFPFFTGACPDPNEIRMYDPYEVANQWVAETGFNDGENLFQTGYSQGYNLSVRGGTDDVRYYLSGDWTDDEGIVSWNYDQKLSLRGNVNLVISDNLSMDVSTGYTQGETRFEDAPGEGGVFHELVWSRSYIPGTNDDVGDVFGERLPTAYQDVESLRRYNRFTGSVTANHTWDFLTQRLIVGLDKAWDTNSQLYPYDETNPFQGLSYNPGSNTGGDLYYARPVITNITFDYAASAEYQLTDEISTTTSIGTQYYFEEEEEVENEAAAFSSPLQTTLNQGSPDEWSIDFTDVQNKSLGVYIQEQLGWEDRIFLTAAVRADDNSAFGSDFDLEYYPKVSGAWVISEESFWNFDFVNSLRLRGAWGRAGRQPSTFAGVTSYTSFAGPGGAPGITPSSPGNEEVGPEVSTEIELGFDFAPGRSGLG